MLFELALSPVPSGLSLNFAAVALRFVVRRPVLICVEKHHRRLNVWVKAAMDGAVLDDLLECRSMLVANAAGEVDLHR